MHVGDVVTYFYLNYDFQHVITEEDLKKGYITIIREDIKCKIHLPLHLLTIIERG